MIFSLAIMLLGQSARTIGPVRSEIPKVVACKRSMENMPYLFVKAEARTQALDCLRRVAKYNPVVVRAALACLLVEGQEGRANNAALKGFLVNRYYFAIPETPRIQYEEQPMWSRPPAAPGETVPGTWPFTFGKKITLEGNIFVAGRGEYDPLADFDRMLMKYGVRR
jgi:hypothetical protein